MREKVNTKMRGPEIHLSRRLLELRGDTKQAAFARSLGVFQQTYARWELGDRQPKLQELARLASHFGVSTDYLLGLTDAPSPESERSNTDWKERAHAAERKLDKVNEALGKVIEGTKALQEAVK